MHASIQYEIAKTRVAEMQQQADLDRAIRAAGQPGQPRRARRGWRLPGIRSGTAVRPAAPGPATPAAR